jgi:DNA-binding response OmpR family regulator
LKKVGQLSTPFAGLFRHGSAGLLHRHILIADDDRAIRGLLQLVAERQGLTVDAVADGVEALQRLEERQYDLAIIDLMMPRLSGYAVVEQLARKATRPVVVVVSAMTDTYVNDLDSGVVHSIVRKPFDVALIGDLMTAIVGRPGEQPQEQTQEQAGADATPSTDPLDFLKQFADG